MEDIKAESVSKYLCVFMRRFVVALLAILYLTTASGATVHFHYCMGKFVNASLVHNEDGTHECENCGMTKKQSKGCCKDEQKVIKTDVSEKGHSIVFDTQSHTAVVPSLAVTPVFANRAQVLAFTRLTVPPPLARSCPIYIQVCNFRI